MSYYSNLFLFCSYFAHASFSSVFQLSSIFRFLFSGAVTKRDKCDAQFFEISGKTQKQKCMNKTTKTHKNLRTSKNRGNKQLKGKFPKTRKTNLLQDRAKPLQDHVKPWLRDFWGLKNNRRKKEQTENNINKNNETFLATLKNVVFLFWKRYPTLGLTTRWNDVRFFGVLIVITLVSSRWTVYCSCLLALVCALSCISW